MPSRVKDNPETITISAHGVQVTVAAAESSVLRTLCDVLPRGWSASSRAREADTGHSDLTVLRLDHRYRIRDASGREYGCPERELAVWMLRRQVGRHVAARLVGRTVLRAAVVLHESGAILLPALALAGTSTLVDALVDLGARFRSDDYAVIDPEGSVVDSAGTLGEAPHSEPLPMRVALVALAVYSKAATWSPTALSEAQAVVALTPYAVSLGERPGEAIVALHHVVSGATLLQGERGDAQSTAKALIDLLDRRSSEEA